MHGFRGRALLVGVSRGGEPGRTIRELAEQLEADGCVTTVEVLHDSLASPFGEMHIRISPDGLKTLDTRIQLDQRLAGLTAAWAIVLVEQPAAAAAR